MGKIRVIPFGYEIVEGVTQPKKSEVTVVIEIFESYADRKSYKTIAQELTQKSVVYFDDKSVWNKNMVARILQNEIYLGDKNYPSLVSKEIFDNVKEVTRKKQTSAQNHPKQRASTTSKEQNNIFSYYSLEDITALEVEIQQLEKHKKTEELEKKYFKLASMKYELMIF